MLVLGVSQDSRTLGNLQASPSCHTVLAKFSYSVLHRCWERRPYLVRLATLRCRRWAERATPSLTAASLGCNWTLGAPPQCWWVQAQSTAAAQTAAAMSVIGALQTIPQGHKLTYTRLPSASILAKAEGISWIRACQQSATWNFAVRFTVSEVVWEVVQWQAVPLGRLHAQQLLHGCLVHHMLQLPRSLGLPAAGVAALQSLHMHK